MDNLIAEGKIKPFIIVMTYGITNEVKWGRINEFKIDHFETMLVKELIPYVDANFRTLSDKENRAMAGLSIGGMETRTITLRNPAVFSHYALLSGGVYAPADITKEAGVKLIFLSSGSKENPDSRRLRIKGSRAPCGFVCITGHGTRVPILAPQLARAGTFAV